MPLHRDNESVAGQFDRLDHAVRIARAGDQALAQLGDGLVVVALLIGIPTDQRGQPSARSDVDARCGEHRITGLVPAVSHDIGQVLVQSAAQCDVENLCAAADAEHRQSTFQRARQQREFPLVAVVAGFVGLGVRRLAVSRRVDVLATGDHQAVQPVEHPVRDVLVDRLRRQQHRDPACKRHALEVNVRQEACPHIPNPGLRLLEVGGHAHDGACIVRAAQSHAPFPNRSRRS